MNPKEEFQSHLSRSTASFQSGVSVPEVAQPKVRNNSLPLGLVEQDVLQLDVAVDDALAVQVAESRQDLFEEAPGDLFLQLVALLVANHVAEVASREEVQDQAVEVADRDDLV